MAAPPPYTFGLLIGMISYLNALYMMVTNPTTARMNLRSSVVLEGIMLFFDFAINEGCCHSEEDDAEIEDEFVVERQNPILSIGPRTPRKDTF